MMDEIDKPYTTKNKYTTMPEYTRKLEQIIQKVREFHHQYELVFIGFQLKIDPKLAELIRFEYKDKFDKLKEIIKEVK